MGANEVVWLAVAGAGVACVVALGCAVAAAWLARTQRTAPVTRTLHVQQPQPQLVVHAPPPMPHAPTIDQLLPVPSADTAGPLVLHGNYPQLGRTLGTWLQVEPDPIERTRIARDLGTLGGGDAARSLLDGVRTGAISPTVAADHLSRGGFEAGIAVAAALRDPEPRVRALATSIVSRTTAIEAVEIPVPTRPMPRVPGPHGQRSDPGHG